MIPSFSRMAATVALLAASACATAATVVKIPDLGAYWGPLSSIGTYVYANSFVAPNNGSVTAMGLWLSGGGSDLQLKIFDSVNADSELGPDAHRVLASSSVLSGINQDDLGFVGVSQGLGSAQLQAGHTYWFVASTVGLGGSGRYTIAAHTPNSDGIEDNGSFWYSNAADGLVFDGSQERPEMAFSVTVSAVPEPSSLAMLLLGGCLLGALRLRRSRG